MRLTPAPLCLFALCASVLCACVESVPEDTHFDVSALPADSACLLVSTAEFGASGAVSWLDPRSGAIHRSVTSTFHDASLRRAGDDAVVLNRLGADNLQWLALHEGMRTQQQLALPAETNPWDYVQRGDRAIVAGYGRGELLTLQRSEGVWSIASTVSLRRWADADGNAEPARLLLLDDTLWVLLQRLDGFACGQTGALLALDWATLEPLDARPGGATIDLGVCNPTELAVEPAGTVLVSAAGVFRAVAPSLGLATEDDGGLVRVDLNSGSASRLWSEARADADVLSVSVAADGSAWALLSDAAADVSVVSLGDDGDGGDTVPLMTVARGPSIFDIEVRGDHVWVADRDPAEPVIRVLTRTGEAAIAPIDVGLAPLEFLSFRCP